MSPCPQGCVNIESIRVYIQNLDCLSPQYRHMRTPGFGIGVLCFVLTDRIMGHVSQSQPCRCGLLIRSLKSQIQNSRLLDP
jgi:hypothetical protein